jgi:hypothetical protein
MEVFFHQVCSKPNNLKVIGKKKTKGAKKDSKNQLRSPMPDGGEP